MWPPLLHGAHAPHSVGNHTYIYCTHQHNNNKNKKKPIASRSFSHQEASRIKKLL